ncbi:MAG: hypothetical protein PGMFKBFP_01229 [Anaerolineales bacterium]|nr:hypothetical protein [Anaerolineales bacterium]
MDIEQSLAEADPCRRLIVQDNGRLAVEDRSNRVDVQAEVAGIAHQEERRELTEQVAESRQPTSHTDVLLGFAMTRGAERHEVVQAMGLLERGGAVLAAMRLPHEVSERDLVMDVVLASVFGLAAHLAAESVPSADAVADSRPVGAVVVRDAGPVAGLAQTRCRLLGEGEPVAGRLQIGGRQVERLLAEVFAAEPTAFAEAGHLRCDLQLSPEFCDGRLGIGDWKLVGGGENLNGGFAQGLGVVIQPDRDQRGDVAGQVEFLHKVLLSLVQVDGARMRHPDRAGEVHFADDARAVLVFGVEDDPRGRGRTERDVRGGICVRHPEDFVCRGVRFVIGDQHVEIFVDGLCRKFAEALARFERQLEQRAAQMLQQDQEMVGVDQRLLGRLPEKIFGMVGEELVERIGRRDQRRRGRVVPASRATRLLPRGRDASRVADEDGRAESADVDPQLEGVRRHHEADASIAESLFDLAALTW